MSISIPVSFPTPSAPQPNPTRPAPSLPSPLPSLPPSPHRHGGISATSIKAVIKAALESGVLAHRQMVEWALKRCRGDEVVATRMVLVQQDARRALAALRNPSQFAFSLEGVTGAQVRKARATLKQDDVKAAVDALEKLSQEDQDAAEEEKEEKESLVGAEFDLSLAESSLLRWVLSVCEYYDKKKGTEPQEQKLILLERKVQQKVRLLEKQLTDNRLDVLERAGASRTTAHKARRCLPRWYCTPAVSTRACGVGSIRL